MRAQTIFSHFPSSCVPGFINGTVIRCRKSFSPPGFVYVHRYFYWKQDLVHLFQISYPALTRLGIDNAFTAFTDATWWYTDRYYLHRQLQLRAS
jgi:hypothetical protein